MNKKFLSLIISLVILLLPAQSWAMWLTIKKGTTSKIITIPIYDSSSTTGGMLTGLVYNSSSLTAYYNREGASGAATSISLVNATKGTWTSGGFIAVDGTNMPGWYELHIPDAALATGANSAVVELKGAANMVPVNIMIQLVDFNPGEVSTGTGSNQLDVTSGRIKADVAYWNASAVATPDTAGYPKVTLKAGSGTGELNLSSGNVTVGTNNDKSGYSLSGTLTTLDSTFERVNTAQAGAAGSITLDAGASATDSLYNGNWVCIMSSTGAGQCRLITGYTGSTKVATVTPNWTTNPSSSSVFAIVPAAYEAGNNGNVAGSVNSVTSGVTVSINNDKTGYSLTQSFPTNFSSLGIDGSGRVDLGKWIGNAPNALISGRVDSNAQVVGDKTGYSLTQSFPTNFSSLSIDSSGRTTLTPIESSVLASGTAQAGASGSITLAAGASATDDLYKGLVVKIYGGTGAGQSRTISGYIGSTKVATVSWNWTATPDNTSTYSLMSESNPSINSSLQVSTTASDPWGTALPGAYGAGTAGNILGNNLNATVSSRLATSGVPTNFSALSIDGSGRVDLAKWIGSAPNALISGRVDSNAQVVGDKTGYTAATVQDKTGYSLSGTLTTLDSTFERVNTAQAGAVGSITLDAEASTTDNLYNGNWVCIMSSTGAGQCRLITGYTGSTKVATVTPNWTTNPSSSSVFAIVPAAYISAVNGSVTVGTNNDKTGYSLTQAFPTNFSSMVIDSNGRIDLSKWLGSAPNALISGRVDANAQVVGDKTGYTASTVSDKTGYSLTQAFPTNFSSLSIDASGRTDIGKWLGTAVTATTTAGKPDVVIVTNNDKTGYTVSTVGDKSGYSLSSAGVAAIWNELQSGHTTSGTFGKYLDAQISTITAPSAATIAQSVWDEPISGHLASGSTGQKLNTAGNAGDPWAIDISSGYSGKAGETIRRIDQDTNGNKDGSDYNGIEKLIRAQR